MRASRILILTLAGMTACGAALYAALQLQAPAVQTPVPLTSFVPQGSLLAIESPDFAGLLKSWVNSKNEQRWVASDDYAGFSRSRLFERLKEAQDQFAASAGLPPDSQFLQQVAGGQSIFTWYDIGKLEFLYITHMPPGDAGKSPLLQLQRKFEQRKAGDAVFFMRTQGDPARTVGFAVRGDYLILATREDLLVSALQLMQQPSATTLQHEGWYAAAAAAASGSPGDLRMTLNLAHIVPSPYFRSYWVQQNISEMKQYSASLSDLYRMADNFREERVLIPSSTTVTHPMTDLSAVLRYLPENSGVYRAMAQPATEVVLEQLEDKLLSRTASDYRDVHIAPVAKLSTPIVGDATNLDQRIDEPVVPNKPRTVALAPLSGILDASHPDVMLAYAATGGSQSEGASNVFLPIHTAVVLSAPKEWNSDDVGHALSTALAPRLTVGTNGLDWKPQHQGDMTWMELGGLQPLAFVVEGKVLILASDRATLLQVLEAARHNPATPKMAVTVAGFSHGAERERFLRLTHLLDHAPIHKQTGSGGDGTPAFFSGNMVGLSNSFQDFNAETFTAEASTAGNVVHQTVLYQWSH